MSASTTGAGSVADAATAALRERLNWLYRRVQRLEDEGEPAESLGEELRRTERALLERARRARLTAAPASVRAPRAALDVGELQRQLGDDDALVEYGVLDDELFACVVTRAGVKLQRRVASWREVQDALRAARFQIETLRHGAAPRARSTCRSLTTRTQSRLEHLHALLWAPLAPALAATARAC